MHPTELPRRELMLAGLALALALLSYFALVVHEATQRGPALRATSDGRSPQPATRAGGSDRPALAARSIAAR